MKVEQALEEIFHTSIDQVKITVCSKGDVNNSYIADYQGDRYFVKIQKNDKIV